MQVKLFFKSSSSNPESSAEHLQSLADELTQFGAEASLVDVDTPEGSAEQDLYDVTLFPTIVVVGPDGTQINSWRGSVPPAAEIRYFLGSA